MVQGATEFLPISSSAHLILAPRLFGWPDQGLGFDIALHGGTLLALLLYFRRDLAGLGRTTPWLPLAVGTVPVIVAGLFLHDWIATSARDPRLLAVTLVVFGLLLGLADRLATRRRGLDTVTWRDGLWVGCAQALALVPGVSRSGVTMTAGLGRGFDRPAAARFSFLLAVPATGLAFAKEALDAVTVAGGAGAMGHPAALTVGFLAAAVTGYAAVGWLLGWLGRHGLVGFVIYRVALGVVLWILVV